jgi:hypothetical protein
MSYRLRGLVWTNAADADIARAAAALRALQRADGGWGQLPSRPTDVYATADVMLALHDAGLPVGDGVYQRGLRYLLDHQQSDGSWRVATRMHEQALVSPPHFEIGFPHGEHQMISCMGSTLAVIAVMRALPEAKTPSPALVDTADWRAAGEAPWMMTALFGSRRRAAGGARRRALAGRGDGGGHDAADDGVGGHREGALCSSIAAPTSIVRRRPASRR